MGLPVILFIEEERKKELAGTTTFRDLIASLQDWLTIEIHKRMVSAVPGKTVNALVATTGCMLHGPGAKNTTDQCKGIARKRKHEGGNNAKGKRPMHELKVGFNAAAVTTNQDKRSAYQQARRTDGSSSANYKGSSSKQGAEPRSNGGHHGSNSGQPRHPGGSLEELMTRSMKGGYRGKSFDPTKSARCQALIAHLQNGGGQVHNYGGGVNALAAVPPPPVQGGVFAFHVHELDISGLDMTPQVSTEPFVLLDPRVLMEDQAERVADRLLRAANQVDDLEILMQWQGSKNPLPFKVYTKIRDDYLEDIDRTMSGTARGDPLTLAEVHMLDLTMQDEILTENSSWDLLVAAGMVEMTPPPTPAPPAPVLPESHELTRTVSVDFSDFELYGADKSDDDDEKSSADEKQEIEPTEHERTHIGCDDKESSADEKEEIEYNEYDIFGSSCDSNGERWYDSNLCPSPMRPITPSYSPPTAPGSPEKVISNVSECNSEEEED